MLAESRQCSWMILLHVELGCGRPDGWYFLPFVKWANTQSHHPYHLAFLCQLESSTNNCLHSRRFERFWRLYDNKLLTLRQFLLKELLKCAIMKFCVIRYNLNTSVPQIGHKLHCKPCIFLPITYKNAEQGHTCTSLCLNHVSR